jgi:hypothetical protein
MRKLFWFVVVVALLALLVDRGADYAAERVVAGNLRTSQQLRSEPDVSIAGFPFLTQFFDRRYDRVTASARDVPAGGGDTRLTLSDVTFSFADVTTNRDFSRFTARTGRARATVSYAELGKVLGITVTYAGKGRIEATKKLTVSGESVSPTITVEPKVLDGVLSFTNSSLQGNAPSQVGDILRKIFRLDLPLSNLPFDIKVTSLSADARGLELRLAGKNLRYSAS